MPSTIPFCEYQPIVKRGQKTFRLVFSPEGVGRCPVAFEKSSAGIVQVAAIHKVLGSPVKLQQHRPELSRDVVCVHHFLTTSPAPD
eukprot:4298410-Karenia_brevis.AAC.1